MKKRMQWICTAGFLTILFGMGLLLLFLPHRSFSEQENRALRTFPQIRAKDVREGIFSEQINEFFSDQLPFRNFWVRMKAGVEHRFGAGENNGILFGEDGHLAKRSFDIMQANGEILEGVDLFDPAHLQRCFDGIRRASSAIDRPFFVMLTGRNIDIYPDRFSYPADTSHSLLSHLEASLAPYVSYVDAVTPLCDRAGDGEYVYYRTDHHWTSLGAYYAYCELMRAFGMEEEILDIGFFEREIATESFLGTLWSAAGMLEIPPDTVEIWHPKHTATYRVTCDGEEKDGFYQREHLLKKDAYATFLDGTHDVVTVTEVGAVKPTLLLLKDSFANSIAPFLANHFNLVMLNLSSARGDYTNLSSCAAEYGADMVLLLYSIENMITTDKLCRLC